MFLQSQLSTFVNNLMSFGFCKYTINFLNILEGDLVTILE